MLPEAKHRVGLYLAGRASRSLVPMLVSMLLPWMLLPWMTVDTEASEDSTRVVEIDASGSTLGEYRLAPGDRLKIVVFDQEQLSGEFIVDGAGGILLPVVGPVGVAGLTVPKAQQLIQERLADGVLVHPVVSVRIPEYRPIFVTGDVRKPGSYPFMFGGSVKGAIAAAGGEGQAVEQLLSVVMSDFIMSDERVRQLEANRLGLRVRKARLEAQLSGAENFIMPQLVGLSLDGADFQLVYSAENDAFSKLLTIYHRQLEASQEQRPRIEAQIKAIIDQIATENNRLGIVNDRLADLENLFGKGLLTKPVLINQRIEQALVQAGLSRLEGQLANLRQAMGDLDVKIEELKASYKRPALSELQESQQRLREIDAVIGTARRLRDVKAAYANIRSDEPDYTILVNRASDSGTVTFSATNETVLAPGDVIEVKLKRRDPGNEGVQNEVVERLSPLNLSSSLADGTMPSR
jgi:polysaccharide biosynthesis/export protein